MTCGRCTATNDRHAGQEARCERVGPIVTTGCVHEHIRTSPLCQFHQDGIWAGFCGECSDHPTRPHDCEIRLLATANSPSDPVQTIRY